MPPWLSTLGADSTVPSRTIAMALHPRGGSQPLDTAGFPADFLVREKNASAPAGSKSTWPSHSLVVGSAAGVAVATSVLLRAVGPSRYCSLSSELHETR